MIKQETIEKISQIFDWFTNKEELSNNFFKDLKYKPKLWNIDTDPFNSLKRLRDNIAEIKDDILNIKIEPVFIDSGESRYQMLINGINITPTTKWPKIAALSTIRQYLQFWYGLGIIEHITDFRKNITYIHVNANFKYVINESIENWNNDLVIDYISYNLNSNLGFARNLAYSLFCVSLFELDNNIFENLEEKHLFFEKRCNKDGTKVGSFKTSYGINYLRKMKKETYNSLIKNIKQANLDDFINILHDTIFNKKEDNYFLYNIELRNINENIDRYRATFKNKTFLDRKEKNLIEKISDLYSDIVSLDENFEGLNDYFNISNACHIYEVRQIKKDAKKKYSTLKNNENVIVEIDNEISKFAQDPNNCIMMTGDIHKLFDRRMFSFNINGEMIYSKENEDYLFRIKKLPKLKIRKEVFNKKMKDFLQKRMF